MDLRIFLEDIARNAGEITLKYFRSASLDVFTKEDASPVTRADRETEQYLRARIRDQFPRDVIIGEEFGTGGSDPSRRWILDPIDGTKSFIHGVPLYGVMIAYEQDGEVTHGCVYLPALHEMVSAGKDEGCYWNGKRCFVSRQTELSKSVVCTTSPSRLARLLGQERHDAIIGSFGIYRGWGDCWGHVLVATGRAEAMLDPRMAIWDAAPLGLIVEEAGGASFDFSGRRGIEGGNLVSCSPAVEAHLRSLMGIPV